MNLSETARLLSAMSAYDRRTIGDGDVIAWQAVLPDASFEDCLTAVKDYYAEQTEWMMPAHVRRLVRDIERARQVSKWAPGQHGVLREQAYPEITSGARLTMADLSPDVVDLLAQLRAALPEGSREALAPRTVAWEREQRGQQRQRDAEPNPHYKPQKAGCEWHEEGGYGFIHDCPACNGVKQPETVQCPLCTATSQDLEAHMDDYHRRGA